METFTISEISKKLTVSKQCISKKLKTLNEELKPFIIIKNNIKYLNQEGLDIINNNLNPDNNLNDLNNLNNVLIESYKNQIEDLKNKHNEHVNDLNKMIKHLQTDSNNKNELLKNMQILLKEEQNKTKLLETKKQGFFNFFRKKQ